MRDELFLDGATNGSGLPSGHDGYNSSVRAFEGTKPNRQYRTLGELNNDVQAIVAQVDIYSSAKAILLRASDLLKASLAHLEFKRPDDAWVKYIAASQILLYIVPKSREYPTFKAGNGALNQQYNDLLSKVKKHEQTFVDVKIVLQSTPTKSSTNGDVFASGATAHQDTATTSASLNRNGAVKHKPAIQPKPQSLIGNSLHSSLDNTQKSAQALPPSDPLAARFAKLRPTDQHVQMTRGTTQSNQKQVFSEPLRMPTPSDFIPNATASEHLDGFNPNSSETNTANLRPAGPRDMPKNPVVSQVPVIPPKIPIDTNSSMPRPPSPTYSPAFTSNQSIVNLSRELEKSASARVQEHYTNGMDDDSSDSWDSDAANSSSMISHTAQNSSKKSSSLMGGYTPPELGSISAQNLQSHLRHSQHVNVLLIDIRDRAEFDQGHIFARSIVCVEPVVLRDGLSAEQLEEALVMSPESESRCFSERHKFDQVVLYDQSSTIAALEVQISSRDFRRTFQNIVDSLTIYNSDKPLKRKLLILEGGLDAWIDFAGPQALQTSQSVHITRAKHTDVRLNQQRSQRHSYVSPSSNTDRYRESSQVPSSSEPMRASYEAKPNSRTKLYTQPISRDPTANVDMSQVKQARRQAAVISNDDNMAYIQTYEDFLRRYPEASSIQESMVAPSPRPYNSRVNQITTFAADEALPQPEAPNAPSRPPPAVPRTSYSGVSEHGPFRTTAQMRIPKYSTRFSCPRGKIGLRNYGNTCYMNAIIQCLNAPGPLSAWALDSAGSAPQLKSKLARAYVEVVNDLYRSGSSTRRIEPLKLRHCVRLGNADFDNTLQHDAQDFFSWFINQLHTDFNINAGRQQLAPLNEAQEERRERVPPRLASKLEWIRYLHNENSYINKLFCGQTSSLLKCPECKNHSTTYEAFMGLPLQILHNRDSVQQSLERFRAEEILKGNDLWKCPKCKRNREARKQVFITRAPRILVLQLMRYEKRMGRPTEKLQTKVSFPLDLDITNSVLRPEPLTNALANEIIHDLGKETLNLVYEPEVETTPPYKYRLYAVARHKGATPSSGHYTAVIYNPRDERWWEYDDERVYACSPDTLQNNQAYLLFYMRSNMNDDNS